MNAPGDERLMRYFDGEREVLQEQGMTPPRAQTVAEIERRLLDLYRDPGLTEKPKLLEQRGQAMAIWGVGASTRKLDVG